MAVRRRGWLAPERALPGDILHFSRKIPVARLETSMNVAPVALLRSASHPRVSWSAVFLKAYGIVSDRCEWLRSSYMSWPLPHVYQHARSVATLAIHRDHGEASRLYWGRFIDPAACSLQAIQQRLEYYCEQPPTEAFRKQLQLSRLPRPLRRLAWWFTLNVSGRVRERQVGTFSMSSLAGQGMINRDHPTVCTSSLSYGPVARTGDCLVTLIYDHRLFDGMQAARALRRLQECLQDDLVAELRQHSVCLVA